MSKEDFIPDDKKVKGAEELHIGNRVIVVEKACTYKTMEAAKMVAELMGVIDVASILPELMTAAERGGDPISQALLMVKLLPMIADKAPEVLFDLAALLMTPNSELAEAYDKPNGIKETVRANRHWLLFEAPQDASLRIVAAFIPHLGLDLLKNAISPLVEKMSGLLKETGS